MPFDEVISIEYWNVLLNSCSMFYDICVYIRTEMFLEEDLPAFGYARNVLK